MNSYEQLMKDVKHICAVITLQDDGAPARWATIATAAMTDKSRWPQLEEVLGHPVTSQLDLFAVTTACSKLMTPAQVEAEANNLQQINPAGKYYHELADNALLVNKLQRMRKKAGLTQQKLAEVTGISLGYILKLERGARAMKSVSADYALRIAEALGTTVDELYRV